MPADLDLVLPFAHGKAAIREFLAGTTGKHGPGAFFIRAWSLGDDKGSPLRGRKLRFRRWRQAKGTQRIIEIALYRVFNSIQLSAPRASSQFPTPFVESFLGFNICSRLDVAATPYGLVGCSDVELREDARWHLRQHADENGIAIADLGWRSDCLYRYRMPGANRDARQKCCCRRAGVAVDESKEKRHRLCCAPVLETGAGNNCKIGQLRDTREIRHMEFGCIEKRNARRLRSGGARRANLILIGARAKSPVTPWPGAPPAATG